MRITDTSSAFDVNHMNKKTSNKVQLRCMQRGKDADTYESVKNSLRLKLGWYAKVAQGHARDRLHVPRLQAVRPFCVTMCLDELLDFCITEKRIQHFH